MRGLRRHRAIAFAAVTMVHAIAIYAFWIGLADSGARSAPALLQVEVIQVDKHRDAPPPLSLPPVDLNRSMAIQIVAPQIDIPLPADPPLLNVETIVPDTALPPQAPGPAPDADVKPKALYVPGGWQRYPAESLRAKETGSPTITICISAAGSVDSVQVTKSSGYPRLDQAAVGIGREARFKPATADGKPVPLCLPYRIKFAMNMY